ncbi:MAG: flagellar assembly protein FliH [Gammaproteobacteria bacterium HGW-Gammaproteobacteria-3]|jgi:flagellar assembly protein FliH|nr:MAG: flagellar assembly protein FliH [Gammaproteobacteria bacterium HGW-Gammaproteobacteria-3]
MSLSKSGGFSDDELEALSLWDMPDVSDDEDVEKRKAGQAKSPVLTVSEIEAMQQQAYDEAYAKGQAEGYEKGVGQGHEEGLEKGYQEGLKKGYDENAQLLQAQAAQLASVLETLSEPLKTLDDAVEKELVDLAIAIARQLLRREIKLDPGQIVAAVREAVSIMPLATQKIRLSLHPDDAELVRSVFTLDETAAAWSIKEDPLISRGGCKVDADNSHVDATLETRLAAVIAQVLGDERNYKENN